MSFNAAVRQGGEALDHSNLCKRMGGVADVVQRKRCRETASCTGSGGGPDKGERLYEHQFMD